jgi:hypothetical protein
METPKQKGCKIIRLDKNVFEHNLEYIFDPK